MQTKTKQRWVGSLILLAITAIFLPLVFHNTHPAAEIQSSVKIPPAPKIDAPKASMSQRTQQQEQKELKIMPAPEIKPAPIPAAPNKYNKNAETKAQHHSRQTQLDNLMAAPQAWTVQLGTFSNVNHANELIDQLRKKGFDAYTRPVLDAKGNRLLRVYVGPEIQKEKALQLRDKLQAAVHLKGVVRKYKVKM